MKKIYTVILLCLCALFMTACVNSGGAGDSPPIQGSQGSEAEKEEASTDNEEGESSENSDLGGNWTGIHSK